MYPHSLTSFRSYGWSTRVKLFCDHFTTLGYYVVMPDFFRGETIENKPYPDFPTWIKNYDFATRVKPDIEAAIAHARLHVHNPVTVAGVGFCWGGWALMKACASVDQKVAFDKAITAHPSFKLESFVFGGDEVSEMEKATQNSKWLILPSMDEPDNCKANGEITKLVESYGGRVRLFDEMNHGFLSRGDCTDPNVKQCCADAMCEIDSILG